MSVSYLARGTAFSTMTKTHKIHDELSSPRLARERAPLPWHDDVERAWLHLGNLVASRAEAEELQQSTWLALPALIPPRPNAMGQDRPTAKGRLSLTKPPVSKSAPVVPQEA
ncbi:hypothetical protein MN608_04225 [Microdochium nivale]|nr:hypothetical protein MN608_04225 [Microdochium nivale]